MTRSVYVNVKYVFSVVVVLKDIDCEANENDGTSTITNQLMVPGFLT